MSEEMDTTGQSSPAGDEDDRKLFVGALPQDAKDEDISEHFSQFGEVESINLKTDPNTGRSRGFAFVVFKTCESLESAVATDPHNIKNKKVAVKKAQAKQGKVYVGKLQASISDDEVKAFFAQYGAIATIEQPFDKMKNERKNFCFITFEKEEPAKKLLKEGTVTLNGVELDVKKVTPKGDMMGGGRGGGRGGRGGGFGGGWGGGWAGDQWGGYGGYGAGYDPYGGGYGAAAWGGYGGGWGGQGGGAVHGGNDQSLYTIRRFQAKRMRFH